MDTKIIAPNKGKNYYSIKKIFEKLFFSFNKEKKFLYDLLYLTITIKIYHKISAKIIFFIINKFGFKFFNSNKVLRLFFFSSIRGMSLNEIFKIRNIHFNTFIKKDDEIYDDENKRIIKEVRKKGYCDITNYIGIKKEEIDEVKNYFKTQQLYNGHDPLQSNLKKHDYSEIYKNNSNHEIFNKGYFSYDAETSLNNTVLKNLFYNKKLKQISDLYCGFNTEPYNIATMLNINKEIKHPVTEYHRDIDDFISTGFFIFWTKTDKNNGATTYKVGSHMKETVENFDDYLEVEPGSIIFGDWIGLHKGNHKMIDRERLITMIRFGNKINHSYFQTKSYYFF